MDKPTKIEPAAEWHGNPDITDKQRRTILKRWENSIYNLYIRSEVRLPKYLSRDVRYLERYGGLAIPIVNAKNEWGLYRWMKRKDGFVIVPLVPSDAALHPFFARALYEPTYWEAPRAIYLPPDRIGLVWRVVILHHELCHARFHRLGTHRGKKIGYWVEEHEVYVKEARLVRAVYGKPYDQLVRQLSKLYEVELRAGKLHIKEDKAVPRERLRQVFGRSHSKLERSMQRSLVILDALYHALDRIHKDGDKSEHYAVTRWFYGESKSRDGSD